MTFSRLTLALAFLAAAAVVSAADLAAGKAKAENVCASCHNADGNSQNPQYPILAGQHPDYIQKALHDYKSGDRSNAIMAQMVQSLSEDDIANVAAWFSSQTSKLNQNR